MLTIPGPAVKKKIRVPFSGRPLFRFTKDQPACDYIMGHEVPHMSSVHRETISDARLKAVTDPVRAWLFKPVEQDRAGEEE